MAYILAFIAFTIGLLLGALFFSRTRPHSPNSVHTLSNSLTKKEAAGLLASVLVQKTPSLIPNVILETNKSIAFEHPKPKHRIHYIFMPKKDIKNIGELGADEREDLADLFSAIVSQINKQKLHNYRVWTNGPGKQDVSYLHFHLGAD